MSHYVWDTTQLICWICCVCNHLFSWAVSNSIETSPNMRQNLWCSLITFWVPATIILLEASAWRKMHETRRSTSVSIFVWTSEGIKSNLANHLRDNDVVLDFWQSSQLILLTHLFRQVVKNCMVWSSPAFWILDLVLNLITVIVIQCGCKWRIQILGDQTIQFFTTEIVFVIWNFLSEPRLCNLVDMRHTTQLQIMSETVCMVDIFLRNTLDRKSVV